MYGRPRPRTGLNCQPPDRSNVLHALTVGRANQLRHGLELSLVAVFCIQSVAQISMEITHDLMVEFVQWTLSIFDNPSD